MRSDMDKVINEPARAGSSNPSRKMGLSIHNYNESEYEDSPKRVPTSHCRRQSGFSKSSGITLNPLRRFLHKKIGQCWNDIYSEIFRRIDKRSPRGNDFMEYLEGEIYINCTMGDDGKIYSYHSYGRRLPVDGFYVHPKTELLEWVKPFRYQAKKPTITKIEFISSVEVVFWGQYTSGLRIKLGKTRLPSPCPLFSRRYGQTILRKENNGWRIDYDEFYDPEEIIWVQMPWGITIKRRKDSPSSPTTFAVKTKMPNKKELREINRLLSLKFRKQSPTAMRSVLIWQGQ